MIDRPQYRAAIEPYIDMPLVKVLAGVRRSGKSTILRMIMNELSNRGTASDCLIHYSFDSLAFADMKTSSEFYRMISKRLSSRRSYLFLDEVQEIPEWERVVNSLMTDFNVDIYVTGSNSRLLASEISTYLTGRYVTIPVYPLSFSEYLDFRRFQGHEASRPRDELAAYLRRGGFPVVNTGDMADDQAYRIVNDIYSSVVLRDIVQKNDIRRPELLERIVRFVFDNAGKTFSAKSISDYLKSQQRALSVETVYNYLLFLEKAFLVYRCSRFDIRGKEALKTQEKFYLVDTSLRHALLGYDPTATASLLENAVYLEIRRRGFSVFVGKLGEKEIDFVAERQGARLYVQVSREIVDEQTEHREYGNLLAIRDGYPKYVLRTDSFAEGQYEGIRTMHVADFLLSNEWG
ncbi:ATP-binding protein [Eggerthella sp. YY7918]|uniref:ATP-binding protein n=1 Tax=Eggerthella sp. (strain YY7918) TaxID=502558 RepID=UPI0002170F9F|nr:AAA family ATPase [Eggerthella sp. YY7918]BAK43814.1 hypothetical protein EGYY_06030 [Eggerthella sp. YY7918]